MFNVGGMMASEKISTYIVSGEKQALPEDNQRQGQNLAQMSLWSNSRPFSL